jgi:hypothetical protein
MTALSAFSVVAPTGKVTQATAAAAATSPARPPLAAVSGKTHGLSVLGPGYRAAEADKGEVVDKLGKLVLGVRDYFVDGDGLFVVVPVPAVLVADGHGPDVDVWVGVDAVSGSEDEALVDLQ